MHEHTTPNALPKDRDLGRGNRHVQWRLHILTAASAADVGRIIVLAEGETTLGRGRDANVQLTDPELSRRHVRVNLQTTAGSVTVEDLASRNGTWLGGQPLRQAMAGHGALLRLGEELAVLEADTGEASEAAWPSADIPGHSEAARLVRRAVAATADHRRPVLLWGPTGTGKERAAAAVHAASGRQGPLVRVNVAAIPKDLFESELFGHKRGAFSGAHDDRPGRVREAHGGTLMLDEIGELPLELQAKLLRVLEEGCVRPVGGSADVCVDVRFLAATQADLAARIDAGKFRHDLAARLRMDVVRLPALSDRVADLAHLAQAVLPLERKGGWAMALDAQAWERLAMAPWSDNLRGLVAVLLKLRRALPLFGRLHATSLIKVAPELSAVAKGARTRLSEDLRVGAVWRQGGGRPDAADLRTLLGEHRGDVARVAQALRRDRRQIYRWMDAAGIAADELAKWRRDPN